MFNCAGINPFGYGVTNGPVNLAAHFANFPRSYTTNFGYETQFNTMPSYIDPRSALLMQGILHPSPWSLQNTNPLAFGSVGQSPFVDSMMTQQLLAQSAAQGAAIGNNIVANVLGNMNTVKTNNDVQVNGKANLNGVKNTVNSLIDKLEEYNENDNLNDSQKQQIQAHLDELHEILSRLEILEQLQDNDAPSKAVNEELEGLKGQLIDLQKRIGKTADAIVKELQDNKPESNDDNGEENADSVKPDKASVRAFCTKFFNATEGLGTDDKELEALIPLINADNVKEIMGQWNKSYKDIHGQTFIKTLLRDCGHYQKRRFASQILDALEARADKAGVDVDEFSAKARAELAGCWINSNYVTKNIDAIFSQILVQELEPKEDAA